MAKHRRRSGILHRTKFSLIRRARVRILCALGTLAHNRSFTKEDVRSYLRYEGVGGNVADRAIDEFIRKGWLRRVEERGHLYPTKTGWRAIEIACRLPAGRTQR